MTTIKAVPESLTREQLTAWIASLGIDPMHCRSMTIDRSGITAEVFALTPAGTLYVTDGEVATHILHIPIVDAVGKVDAALARIEGAVDRMTTRRTG